MSKRKNLKPARVALKSIKGERNVSELASQYGVYPTQTHLWKNALLRGAPEIF